VEIVQSLVIYGGRKPIKGSHAQLHEDRADHSRIFAEFYKKILEDVQNPQSKNWNSAKARSDVERMLLTRERVAETAYRILECLAIPGNAGAVTTADLDRLAEELDQHTGPLRFDPEKRAFCRHRSLMLESQLLEYMNLCVQYGPEHGICARKECGALMISGRGAKKYCSPQCRKLVWGYAQNKEYYQQHRKYNRKHHSRNKNARSSHKSSTRSSV